MPGWVAAAKEELDAVEGRRPGEDNPTEIEVHHTPRSRCRQIADMRRLHREQLAAVEQAAQQQQAESAGLSSLQVCCCGLQVQRCRTECMQSKGALEQLPAPPPALPSSAAGLWFLITWHKTTQCLTASAPQAEQASLRQQLVVRSSEVSALKARLGEEQEVWPWAVDVGRWLAALSACLRSTRQRCLLLPCTVATHLASCCK